ncbi:hypothetical protein Ade02nite_19680 [Paractinoplanes deccanensis]|uniref:Phage tail protein n=1 Tax=Paractinoplanes deccanensis TaxID=113561 RepID=A0ABQ3Y053_9ACTN|nr:hypothetical protein [Actinoplanes deccanensis]GID73327.1 hypothetical protein Ade02nite_19680 [Actinoplanes deccanensis]
MPDYPAGYSLFGGASSQTGTNLLTVGEETIARDMAISGGMITNTQVLRLTHFTARKSESTTQVRMISGGTAAAATPTLVRMGLYLVDGNGDGTLVASTANDTSLFAATNTAYTRSWTAPYAKVAGQRYALGVLVVTAATAPQLVGNSIAGVGAAAEPSVAPRLSGSLAGQADLPASFTAASLAATGQRFYGVLLP